MSDNTKIEWTDATWNVVNGCSVHTPGCTNCYAMKLAGTRLRNHPSRAGLTRGVNGNHVWTGEVRFNDKVLTDPLRWKRPRRIFVCAHGDLFHEAVPDEWIDRVFAVMALATQHQFQVLTKRSARMREYFATPGLGFRLQQLAFDHHQTHPDIRAEILRGEHSSWFTRKGVPLAANTTVIIPNVWLGVSVEDQARADLRVPDLLATPAAVRWLSCEPLLGPVDVGQWLSAAPWERTCSSFSDVAGVRRSDMTGRPHDGIDWIVAGGESGLGARPMHPDWARSLRDQCVAAGVPFLFKQWGEWLPGFDECPPFARGWRVVGDEGFASVGKKRAGRLLDGVQHDGFPV